MATTYPIPAIYYYRVTHIWNPRQVNSLAFNASTITASGGYFIAEYSTNGGVAYLPLFPFIFEDLQPALQAIGIVVTGEANFQSQVNTSPPVVTQTEHIAYPQ